MSIFAEGDRLRVLSAIGDKLEKITKAAINWERFREKLEEAIPQKNRTEKGGRPSYDLLLLFKICLLQSWYGLSDEQAEYQINDRLSFQRFLGMDLSSTVPDRNTIWTFKEKLSESGAPYDIFSAFNEELERLGIITHKGTLIDATFVEAPRQRNGRGENDEIKSGKTPEGWSKKKRRHKDTDARWTKKNGISHYGYKDHLKVDRDSKIITDYEVTTANVHDSQCMGELIDKEDREVWADSAYAGGELAKEIQEKNPNIILHVNEKGYRNKPLTEEQKRANREKSRTRARVEHVNGQMTMCGGLFIRKIGQWRAVVSRTLCKRQPNKLRQCAW